MRGPPVSIPATLPLSPSHLFGPRAAGRPGFPFGEPRTRTYYLARNAIWHGADILGLKRGDEILMPAYHHGIEVQTLRAKGLEVRFYRIDDRMEADLDDVDRKLGPATRALYVIHYLGYPQPIEELARMARRHSVPLIEDCALSLFSRAPTAPLGSFGDISVFCLYKSLPVPHGGVLVVNRPDLPIPSMPMSPDRISTGSYVLNRLLDGWALGESGREPRLARAARRGARAVKAALRSRVTPIDTEELDVAVLDLGASPIVHRILERTDAEGVADARSRNYRRLADLVRGAVRPALPEPPEGACPLSFPILVRDKAAVRERLLAKGIETINMWSRRQPDLPEGAYPEVDFLRRHVLEAPIHQGLRSVHLDRMAPHLRALASW